MSVRPSLRLTVGPSFLIYERKSVQADFREIWVRALCQENSQLWLEAGKNFGLLRQDISKFHCCPWG